MKMELNKPVSGPGYGNKILYYKMGLQLYEDIPDSSLVEYVPFGPHRSTIAIQLRRGDFEKTRHFIAPSSWYIEQIDRIWPKVQNPSLYIASDEIDKVVGDFEKYHPLTYKDIFEGNHVLSDFWALSHANYVMISNSTFGYVACMWNKGASVFYRPGKNHCLKAFNPWRDAPMINLGHYGTKLKKRLVT
jgi:hypothetical protein